MIIDFATKITREAKQRGENPLYIRSLLKEYLQTLLLYYLYTTQHYKTNLVFTGGTCLRHFYGLERLSEDLDFDSIAKVDAQQLVSDLQTYFISKLQYKQLDISIKQQGQQVLLKFPILRGVGLATESESDLLYIKCDIKPISTLHYQAIRSAKSAFGYNFVAVHYDLPSLFAGKIVAILTRNLFTGKESRQTIKGRDFYDMLWYLKRGVYVNLPMVQDMLNKPDLTLDALQELLSAKVLEVTTRYSTDFQNDLLPFIADRNFLDDYVENYAAEFSRYVLTE